MGNGGDRKREVASAGAAGSLSSSRLGLPTRSVREQPLS